MAKSKDFSERVRTCVQHLAESGPPALSGLFDLTASRLVRFSTTITRNQHDAEDAVQAALLKVAKRPELLNDANRPWHYLLQIVRNESLGILRHKKRWTFSDGLGDLLTRKSVDQLELEDQHRAIWLALRTLPNEQSEVIVLKIWEEMTFAEIACVLEQSPSTVASRYRYAIEKLSARLKPSHETTSNNSEVTF